MAQFMMRRTLYAIVTLFILSLTIFTVVRLTGDPVTLLAEPGARAEDLDRVRAEWGLDRPWPVQYLAFAKNVFTGELGQSFNYEMPVSTLYFQRLPNSLELALAATLISFLPFGAILNGGRRPDRCDPSHRATLPSPGGRAWGDGSAGRQSATWQGSANHRGSEGLAGVFGLSESQGLRLPA